MESSPEARARRAALARTAPLHPKGVWRRQGACAYLCGTVGAEFDVWQRRLSVTSAADALFAQQIGLEAVERVMDELEASARREVEAAGKKLMPRRSPGYGDLPLALSRTILDALDAPRKIGVSITDSNLLVPSKSVTAICEIC